MIHRGQGHLDKEKVLGISRHNHCFYFSMARTDIATFLALAFLCRAPCHDYPPSSISNRYFQAHQQSQQTLMTKHVPQTLQLSPVAQLPGQRSKEGENYHCEGGLHLEGLHAGLDVLGNVLGDAQLNPDVKKGLPGRWGSIEASSDISLCFFENMTFPFSCRHL